MANFFIFFFSFWPSQIPTACLLSLTWLAKVQCHDHRAFSPVVVQMRVTDGLCQATSQASQEELKGLPSLCFATLLDTLRKAKAPSFCRQVCAVPRWRPEGILICSSSSKLLILRNSTCGLFWPVLLHSRVKLCLQERCQLKIPLLPALVHPSKQHKRTRTQTVMFPSKQKSLALA